MAAEKEKELKAIIDKWLSPIIVWHGSSKKGAISLIDKTLRQMLFSAARLSQSLGTYIMYQEQAEADHNETEARIAALKEQLKQREENG